MLYGVFTDEQTPKFIGFTESEFLAKEYAKAKIKSQKRLDPYVRTYSNVTISKFQNYKELIDTLCDDNPFFSMMYLNLSNFADSLRHQKIKRIQSADGSIQGVCLEMNETNNQGVLNGASVVAGFTANGTTMTIDLKKYQKSYLTHATLIIVVFENYLRNSIKKVLPIPKEINIDMVKLALLTPDFADLLGIYPIEGGVTDVSYYD